MTSPQSGPPSGADGSRALLVRGGYVITMDPGAGDIPDGDVLVSGGAIAAVGADGRVLKQDGILTTLDAERIGRDARQALAGVIERSQSARR